MSRVPLFEPAARLVRRTDAILRVATGAAFFVCAAFLLYAAARGIQLRMGRQFLSAAQALWPAGICLVFGCGLLLRPRYAGSAQTSSAPALGGKAAKKPGKSGARKPRTAEPS